MVLATAQREGGPVASVREPPLPLLIGVPRLAHYDGHTGVARVFHSLRDRWSDRVRLLDAPFDHRRLPLLRNFPSAVRVPFEAHVVLLPQLTGAQALRDTGGVPSVAIVHDIGVVDFPGDRAAMNWLSYQSVRRSFGGLRHATRILTVSHFTRDRLLRRMPFLGERVRVVPNGVDEVFLRPAAPEARRRLAPLAGLSGGGPLVLNVGSDAPRKNVPLLLEVFMRIKGRHPEARLIRVRGGADPRWGAETARRARALGLRPGSDLLVLDDVADDATLADLYAAADVYLSTSLYEGFGLPALEALAVGTPVVVTRCGALPEVVGDVGRAVEPRPEALARAVEDALAEPRQGRRSRAGRARAATFSWSRSADACLGVMCDVMDEVGARAGAQRGPGW
jgi:glycosyltransferase involved in cell wall biosynthesis